VGLCAGLLALVWLALVWLGGYAVVEQVMVRLVLHRRGLPPLPSRPFLEREAGSPSQTSTGTAGSASARGFGSAIPQAGGRRKESSKSAPVRAFGISASGEVGFAHLNTHDARCVELVMSAFRF